MADFLSKNIHLRCLSAPQVKIFLNFDHFLCTFTFFPIGGQLFYKIIPSFYVMKRKNGLFGLTIFEFLLYLKRMSTSKNNFEENPVLVFKIFCIKLYHSRICIVALAYASGRSEKNREITSSRLKKLRTP